MRRAVVNTYFMRSVIWGVMRMIVRREARMPMDDAACSGKGFAVNDSDETQRAAAGSEVHCGWKEEPDAVSKLVRRIVQAEIEHDARESVDAYEGTRLIRAKYGL